MTAPHTGPGNDAAQTADYAAGDVEALGSDLLAYHGDYRVNDDGWTVCICGHVAEGDDDDGSHARHVAAVVLASDWLADLLARERAKALRDAADHIAEHYSIQVGKVLRERAARIARTIPEEER